MEAKISSYRKNRTTQKPTHMILVVSGVDKKDKTASLIGKEVVWTCPGKNKKEIKGKIVASHGNKGAVRAIMENGMPGQSLGTAIKVK
jgi:large subunit ribosomal protein L35Ae